MTNEERVLCGVFLASVAFVGAACSAGDSESQGQYETTVAPGTEVDPQQREVMTLDMDTQVARAMKLGEKQVRVDILSRAGEPLFTVDIRSGVPEGETLTWQLHQNMEAEPAAREGSVPVPLEALPALRDAINMAVFVQDRVVASVNGKDYDNWGCDLPFTDISSCSPVGGCCDIHDECYADHGCNASSWYKIPPWTSFACMGCNARVVACIGSASQPALLLSLPGPSVCCSRGTCGDPR
ncbi:hypothetical protein [Sorangium sp. So ce1000]|uniref:hypothetical protein n=1 Tax=Sorangium sp. So ce1000 TaxID=3133325 RepID=UPI003F63DBD2